jgi:HlyD family secretion protein
MKWVKRAAMAIVALAILCAIAYGFIPKPVPSEFATVVRGDLRATIDVDARTRVKDRFTIHAPLAGDLTRITLKAGDALQAGDPIAVLQPLPPPLLDARARAQAEAAVKAAQAGLSQAEAGVTSAAAQLDLAAREHTRVKELLKGRHVSVEQVDIARTREEAAQAALESANFARDAAGFQLEMARAALREDAEDGAGVSIESPVAGSVLRVFRQSEGPVAPGEVLIEIGNPGSLEVVADLLSTDAVRVHKGMKVSIERWGGDALEGTVRLVEPFGFTKFSALGVEEQRVNVIIDFNGPPDAYARLGDGYRVEARVVMSERKGVLKVPEGALFNTPEGPALFVVVDDRALVRNVQVGTRSGTEAEVLSAVNAGDTVIVHPSDEIEHGKRVEQR